MKKISSYLTNFDAPSAGFSEGKLKDNPGDGTGSGATVAWANDIYYGFLALANKFLGGISDTDESETASDVLNSIETAIGTVNPNVAEYDNTTTYAQDDHVMYLGLQFVSMEAGNTGNNPLDNPDKWFPCPSRDEVVKLWRDGEDISGGFGNLHNVRHADYRQFFKMGKYNFGGDSGRNFQATGLHLDGTIVTGDATLEALLDVGGVNEYHLLDVIAPDVMATRTLMDAKGKAGMSVDAVAGLREDVGGVQQDQMQLLTGESSISHGSFNRTWQGALYEIATTTYRSSPSQAGTFTNRFGFDSSQSPDARTSATTDGETRPNNYSKGLPYVVIMQEI